MIAVFDFNKCGQLWTHACEMIDGLPDSPTLNQHYQPDITPLQWARIKLFEWHFAQIPGSCDLDYEDQLQNRWKFFYGLKGAKNVSQQILQSSNSTILRRNARKNLAQQHNSIQLLLSSQFHLIDGVENDIDDVISSALADMAAEVTVICVDCTKMCRHPGNNLAHKYLSVPGDIQTFHGVSTLIGQCTIKLQ